MASRQSVVDFLLEQIAAAGTVRARRMFGKSERGEVGTRGLCKQ